MRCCFPFVTLTAINSIKFACDCVKNYQLNYIWNEYIMIKKV